MKNLMNVMAILSFTLIANNAGAEDAAAVNAVPAKTKKAAKSSKGDITVKLDTKASTLTWTGKKVTGEHTGTIGLKDGQFKVKPNMESISGTVNVDMKTITNTDLKDEGYNKKLVGHLSNEDFFNVEKFPGASLKINKMVIAQTFAPGTPNAEIDGELTIKGKTLPIQFKATFTPNPKDHSFEAVGTALVDRTAYDIKYGSGKFFQGLGDKMIDDQFKLDFKIVAKK